MNGYERLTALFRNEATDCLPLMPITMMFAANQGGVPYGKYATDHRLLVEAQLKTAEKFDFDFVSSISDPAREAADCGATIQYFEDQPPAAACLEFSEEARQAGDVVGVVGQRVSDRLRDDDARSTVHDRCDVGMLGEDAAHQHPVGVVALVEREALGEGPQPPGQVVDDHRLVAGIGARRGDRRADVARASGDEHLHRVESLLRGTLSHRP